MKKGPSVINTTISSLRWNPQPFKV